MLHPVIRLIFFVVLTVVFSACLTMLANTAPESSTGGTPTPTASPSNATQGLPTSQPTTNVAQPTPTAEPTIAAGPPFSNAAPGTVLVDNADVFSAETEQLAADRIAAIATNHDASVVVYTQYKPGSDARSTETDAIALKLKWRVTEGLVIMWNTTRPECMPGAPDNAQIQLYADNRFSATRMSELKRQQIYDDVMLPLLLDCNDDDALLDAIDAIAEDIRAPAPPSSSRPTSSTGACADDEFRLSDFRWDRPFEWSFQESSVPDDLDADEVLEVITRSVSNITDGRNDCGRPDKIDAEATYVGTTREPPCASDESDGYSTVGFAELPEEAEDDTLAFVCTYGEEEVVEADILINRDVPWALSEDECTGFEEVLEATMTHEFGHVFGLAHVSERAHGDLTMSPTSNGACTTDEISLGLGDLLGLEELY